MLLVLIINNNIRKINFKNYFINKNKPINKKINQIIITKSKIRLK
jgi:hypothetical protein